MATMSSICQEAVESSQSPARRRMQCVLSSMPSRPQQSKTQITGAGVSPKQSLRRRRHRLVRTIRRKAPPVALCQDPRPFKGHLLLSHRNTRPTPSSGKARGLSPGGPSTLPRSRGRRSGTTWRCASKHVSLGKEQGKEGQTRGSSSARSFRSCRSKES